MNHPSRVAQNTKQIKVDLTSQGILWVIACGAANAGTSSLVSRLLLDVGQVADADVPSNARDTHGSTGVDTSASVEDGLRAGKHSIGEPKVSAHFMRMSQRLFAFAGVSGQEQHFLRNLALSALRAPLAVLVVDAPSGLTEVVERQANICSLIGTRHVILAVNKMDQAGFAQDLFYRIAADFAEFCGELGFGSIAAIPVVATVGGNVAVTSSCMPWYHGLTLQQYLLDVGSVTAAGSSPFRFCVENFARSDSGGSGYAGIVESGCVSVGGEVVSASSGRQTRVQRILVADGEVEKAHSGGSATLGLNDEIDIAPGDVLAPANNRPEYTDQFATKLLWLDEVHLLPGRPYELRTGTRRVPVSITAIKHRIGILSRQRLAAPSLERNEIGVCNLATSMPIAIDYFAENRETGSFALVDGMTNATVAAGMVMFGLRRATNIHVEELFVDRAARQQAKRQKATVIWFTGLSGSGQSTIAKRLEKRLHDMGNHTYVLDGDNVWHGLNHDLGFTDTDRVENIRRIGEVAELFADAGLVVMCSFISSFRAERRMVRELLENDEFVEVFVDASIEGCKRRDPKCLYAKALAGKVKNFTGIYGPYGPPENADMQFVTENVSADAVVDQILEYLRMKERI